MSRFLKHLRIDSFGAFSNKTVGPFTPGLNVVYGKNEAGKTTLASFVGGVLFGWEEARGLKNTYKPANADRSGALFFASENAAEGERELSRARNVDGPVGATEVLADIDKRTYATMFSLTSDELRSLNNTSNMTARLLTAGSGTSSSPAAALDEVQRRIATYSSRAAGAQDSIVRLNEDLADMRRRMSEAALQTDRYKAEDREYHELVDQRDDLARRVRALNREIERLTAWKARLEKLDEQRENLVALRADFDAEVAEFAELSATDDSGVSEQVLRMSSADERLLRDELDEYAEEQAKIARGIDIAQENKSSSQATYEALLEMDAQAQGRPRRTATVQIVVALLVSLVCIIGGVPLFLHGREIGSLSFTAAGIGMVAVAVMTALVAILSVVFPNKQQTSEEDRKNDAQWVMLQDKKKLEAVMATKDQLDDDIRTRLERAGLSGAQGSIRAARSLLDEAREIRAARRAADQRTAAFDMRGAKIQASFDDLDLQRAKLASDSDLGDALSIEALDDLIDQKTDLRDALIEETAATNERFGQLTQELAQAREMRDFDELKLEYHELRCRLADAEENLVRLLLAQHMLIRGITTWESRSQPEVYAQASRLMAVMTGGAWVRVEMTSEGRMIVQDAAHNTRDPRHLSLGTCQQLYLALRIALLMCAENVGASIPILADDILVHFDDDRRVGAAAALAELAQCRQVILFTCHREVVEVMQAADSACTVLEL